MRVRALGQEDPLEQDMAAHSIIPAWTILKDKGVRRSTVSRGAKSWTRLKQLSPQTCTQFAKCMKRASAHAIA